MTEPIESILDGTKKAVGLGAEYDVYDADILMHINSVFFTLNQLGVGPAAGYAISGPEETWSSYLGDDPNLAAVRSYTFLRVRMLFDPPPHSFTQQAMFDQIKEYEWRLNVYAENTYADSSAGSPSEIDGGVI